MRGRRVGLCGSTTGGNLVEKTAASQVIEYLGLIKCGLPLLREPRIADWFGFTPPETFVLDIAHSRSPTLADQALRHTTSPIVTYV